LFITESLNLSKLSNGSWRINASYVRMVVNTSEGQEKWKNVEITGYVRSTLGDFILMDLLVGKKRYGIRVVIRRSVPDISLQNLI
jgi:hypothetical protein